MPDHKSIGNVAGALGMARLISKARKDGEFTEELAVRLCGVVWLNAPSPLSCLSS